MFNHASDGAKSYKTHKVERLANNKKLVK